jgi:signal transduction histidine kinase
MMKLLRPDEAPSIFCTRDDRIHAFRALLFIAASVGGFLYGSPLPRCLLGVFFMMMNYCLKSCSTWQRTLALGLVYTVGPSMELLDTWTARETLGASSAEYSILWFDAFVFSLIMQMSLPFIASTLGIPFRHFICQVVFYIPFGATWATVLPPQWVIGTDADYLGSNASRGRLFFLMLLALIASIGIFAGLDQTSREFVERSRAHERYIAALSHDFGTPISALQMATSQLPQHMRSPVEDSGVKPLLDGMAAALEVMAALKRKAIDVGKLQLGESLTPERAPFNLRELIMRKLPAITRYMPHNASVHTWGSTPRHVYHI